MNIQPTHTYINPWWFFAKIGVICALGIIVCVQVYSLLWPGRHPVLHVSPITVTASKPKPVVKPAENKQAPQPKGGQVKQADKQPEKPSLTKALLDPETYAAVKGDYAHRLDAPYGRLYKELNLDNNTLQKLRSLLAEKELTLAEGQRLAKESGTPLSNDSLAALRSEVDGPIRELLGEEAYTDYKYYESTLHLRNHANVLEQYLSYKSEPLTSEQYNAFVNALAKLPESKFDSDRGAWMGDRGTLISDKTLKVASGILTQSQFAVYEREYEMQLLGQEITKEDAKKAVSAKKKAGGSKKK